MNDIETAEQVTERLAGIEELADYTPYFISQGAYGMVWRIVHNETGEVFALKLTDYADQECQGMPPHLLREISALTELNEYGHPNLVKLHKVAVKRTQVLMFFEYCPNDLSAVIKHHKDTVQQNPSQISALPQIIKSYLMQILKGVHAIHCNRIMHRDLKPQNILLGDKGVIKIADFGLARAFSVPLRPYSHEVVTMWYRSPELLLGATEYTIAVDMWSVGCIFFEMVVMQALFPGDTAIEMIERIFELLGTPNTTIWPEYEQLPVL